jgi:hypothetical protein
MPSKRNSIRRDLFFGIILTALVFVCALIFGGPFLSASPSTATPAGSASPAQTQTTTVNGTVKRNGDQVYLSDRSGNTYMLDHQQFMRKLDGRFVSITGQLNSRTMRMHIEKVETIDA